MSVQPEKHQSEPEHSDADMSASARAASRREDRNPHQQHEWRVRFDIGRENLTRDGRPDVRSHDHAERLREGEESTIHECDHENDRDRGGIEDCRGDGACGNAGEPVGREPAEHCPRALGGERLDPDGQLHDAEQEEHQASEELEADRPRHSSSLRDDAKSQS
jgi:hypothetical protein